MLRRLLHRAIFSSGSNKPFGFLGRKADKPSDKNDKKDKAQSSKETKDQFKDASVEQTTQKHKDQQPSEKVDKRDRFSKGVFKKAPTQERVQQINKTRGPKEVTSKQQIQHKEVQVTARPKAPKMPSQPQDIKKLFDVVRERISKLTGAKLQAQQPQPLKKPPLSFEPSRLKYKPSSRPSLLSSLKKVENTADSKNTGRHVEQLLEKKIAAELQDKQQKSQYQLEEYQQGEVGIEVTPVAQQYNIKLKRHLKELQDKRQRLTLWMPGDKEQYDNPGYVSKRLQDYRQVFRAEATDRDKEIAVKVIQTYPGSPKGPDPMDDPEAYLQYLIQNIPESLHSDLGLDTLEQDSGLVEEGGAVSRYDIPTYTNQYPTQSQLAEEYDLVAMDEQTAQNEWLEGGNIVEQYEKIPKFPEFKYQGYQQLWGEIIPWAHFRNQQVINSIGRELEEGFEDCAAVTENPNYKPTLKPSSLYYYYRTLPKSIQDHPGVKDVYLGLEYSFPDWSITEKEKALNLAAYFTLPLDEVSDDIVKKHLAFHVYEPTSKQVERILNMKAEHTYDIEDYITELKEEQLRGQAKQQDQEEVNDFPVPKQPVKPELANLPVDYYDNDDGFWDDYIKQKMEKYEATPLLRNRPYLKH